MGKVANYDQNGKLKNNVITAKYAGEFELRNMLDDQAWKKLGACEISCVDCYDSKSPSVTNKDRMAAVNAEIVASLKAGIKPKTEVELLKEQVEKANEQNKAMAERLERLEKSGDTEKETRKALFNEAKELGLTPQKNILTDDLKALVENAKK